VNHVVPGPIAGPSDYDLDVARADADIAELQQRVHAEPADVSTATRLLYRRYHRHTLTGHTDDLPALRDEVERTIHGLGANGDLCMLLAQIDFTLHQFAHVPADLQRAPGLSATRPGRALLADVHLRAGDIEHARTELEELQVPPMWEVLSRLAEVHQACGDDQAADRTYAAAQDELSAKQMRAYAWLELQRGKLDLRHRRTTQAEEHYRRADQAYTGYWLIDEHTAALLSETGNLQQAEVLLRRVVARVPRPTARQALGRVLQLQGRHDAAQAEYTAALVGYEASARAGHVHYLHHLVDYYTSVEPDPQRASEWARRDAEAATGTPPALLAGANSASSPTYSPFGLLLDDSATTSIRISTQGDEGPRDSGVG
jgi:tetratricopeptide (TPR) repeat protein